MKPDKDEIASVADLHKSMLAVAHRTDDRIYAITIANYAGVGAILSFSGGENGLFQDHQIFIAVFALLISLTAAQAVRRYSASAAIHYKLQNLALKAWLRGQSLSKLNEVYNTDELSKIETAELPQETIDRLAKSNQRRHKYSYQVFFNAAPGVFVAVVVVIWQIFSGCTLLGLVHGLRCISVPKP